MISLSFSNILAWLDGPARLVVLRLKKDLLRFVGARYKRLDRTWASDVHDFLIEFH